MKQQINTLYTTIYWKRDQTICSVGIVSDAPADIYDKDVTPLNPDLRTTALVFFNGPARTVRVSLNTFG